MTHIRFVAFYGILYGYRFGMQRKVASFPAEHVNKTWNHDSIDGFSLWWLLLINESRTYKYRPTSIWMSVSRVPFTFFYGVTRNPPLRIRGDTPSMLITHVAPELEELVYSAWYRSCLVFAELRLKVVSHIINFINYKLVDPCGFEPQ